MKKQTLNTMPVVVRSDTILNGFVVDVRRRGQRHYAVHRELVGTVGENGNITAHYPLTARELAHAQSLMHKAPLTAGYRDLLNFREALRVRRRHRQLNGTDRDAARVEAVLQVIGHP